ncbi:MAG TPA: response regulator [Candidatus Cloacimonetes bacterium]|nr:response regulator [Candidatus Cloacimonadota bacterium]HEX38307.1 response regulator [Candidatus Cloacimonadota bacterium]
MDSANEQEAMRVLLISSDEADITIVKEVLSESNFLRELYVVRDGEESLDFLFKHKNYIDVPTPDLILLDLDLPNKNAREVLKEIKHDDILRLIPVVVLATSNSQYDINECYSLHANSYIIKPVDLDNFNETIRKIEEFWFTCSSLPSYN